MKGAPTTNPAENSRLPRISVVDDDPDLRTFFQDLADSGQFVLVGAFENAREALKALPRSTPDVVFVDYQLPDISGIECTAKLTTVLPHLKIILITGYPEASIFLQALRAGAVGFVVKPFNADEASQAINEVVNEGVALGRTALPYLRRIIRQLRHRDLSWNLTEREEQLIACVFEGLSYKEIGTRLSIETSTVHTHMDHLFAKLGVHSQEELIQKFLQA